MSAEEIEEVAARWLVRQDEAGWTEESRAELKAWLASSPAHEAAYYRLEYSWRMADRLAALRQPAVGRTPGFFSRHWWGMSIAASLLIVCLTSTAFLYRAGYLFFSQTYQTEIGGRSTVPMKDGTTVDLNTNTTLRTDVNSYRRTVWLDRGEAYFEVAHDATSPFVVWIGSRKVTVLGTKFLIRRTGDDVRVTVIEGRVRFDPSSEDAAKTKVLTHGESVFMAARSELVLHQSAEELQDELSWREGRLSFDGNSFADVVAEFNRYNRKQVVVVGSARNIPISGHFKATNVDAFVRLVKRAYGLQTLDRGESIIISY